MIYLDYHGTTPVDVRVAEKVLRTMTEGFGNASSLDHEVGDGPKDRLRHRAEAAVKAAARHVADLVGASPRDLLFTSGATESLNLAIQGTINTLSPLSQVGRGAGGEGNPPSPSPPSSTKPSSTPAKPWLSKGASICCNSRSMPKLV